jgi:iron complex transport system ATP-binding protein
MKIEVQDASFSYGEKKEVFSHVNFTADQGQIVSILGPNGAGKTTFLKCILGFRKWDGGTELLDGIPRKAYPSSDFWKKAAYVPQARAQAFPYTVEETVLLGRSAWLSMFEMPHRKDYEKAEAAMKLAGITHLKDKNCNEISGGELQLTLIARALAGEPEVLIMDEPETGLDFRNQLIVLHLIQKLSREQNLTVIFNTHYPDHALEISDETLLLLKGNGSLFGPSKEVLKQDNLAKAFGVEIRMLKETIDGKEVTTIVPVALQEDH